jgi:hypothetical protein
VYNKITSDQKIRHDIASAVAIVNDGSKEKAYMAISAHVDGEKF